MRIEEQGDVQILRLEGGKANAMSARLLGDLRDLLATALARPGPLVLTGYGGFFSGGLDLPSLVGLDRAALRGFVGQFEETMLAVFAAERPVVAAINGHAIAGGCLLALQADYRVMAAGTARIGLSEVQLGIGLPASVIETLRAQVPAPSLLPIALEGRLLLPEEALGAGLVHQVIEPAALLEAAVAKARELGALPAHAFAHIKRSMRAPVIRAARASAAETAEGWLDTWFHPEAQRRLTAAVARLSAPR